MASVLTTPQPQPRSREARGERFRISAGVFLALGILSSRFGFAWDVNWHSDVGPDTFFTLPHLFIYSGVALGGITCLVTVLYSSWSYHQGRSLFPHASLTLLFWGVLRAPASFIIGGLSALLFFFYGLFDELWHSIYGFDVTIQSPPHVGLILSMFISVAGCIGVFAGAKSKGIKLSGVAFSVGTTLIALVLNVQALGRSLNGLSEIAIAVLFAFGFVLVISLSRSRGAALLTALTVTLFQLLCWYVVPLATRAYATSLGLFLRDYVSGRSLLAAATPMFGSVAALGLETLLWFGRKRNWPVRITITVAGILSALIMLLPIQYLYNLKPITDGSLSFFPSFLSVVSTSVLGGAFSYFAWLLGSVLRRKAQ
jgi:hypothetical protein